LGKWEVVDIVGEKLGENEIRIIEGDCFQEEQWTSVTIGMGRSWNYADADSAWNQLWFDARGSVLKIRGSMD
jgi:hypothetical protein